MPISAIIDGRKSSLEVTQYSVSEDATPLAPGDSSGGTGSMSFTTRAVIDGPIALRTASLAGHSVQLSDTFESVDTPFAGRGSVYARITSCSQPGEAATFSADNLMSRLNVDKSAAPFFGALRSPTTTSTRTNLVPNPSVESNLTGYSATNSTGSSALSVQSGTGMQGSSFVRQQWTVASTGPNTGTAYSFSVSTPSIGGMYTASAYVRVNKANPSAVTGTDVQNLIMIIQWYTAGSIYISSTTGPPVRVINGVVSRISLTSAAPAGAGIAALYIQNTPGAGYTLWQIGDQLEVDGLLMEQAQQAGVYFDGSSAGSVWTGTANASTSTETKTVTRSVGKDGTLANAVRYYASLAGISDSSILIDELYEYVPVAFRAWSGSVWDHMKQLCSAYGAEMVMRNDVILFREPRKHAIPVDKSIRFTQSVSTDRIAQAIEIVNYNNQWRVDSLAFQATSVYSVGIGQFISNSVTSTASLTSINQPRCVAAIRPKPYNSGSGQYVVTDSNNLVVDPAWWAAAGGLVQSKLDPLNYSNIILEITGPRSESTTYKAPFRLAEGYDSTEIPALFVTGEGVFSDEKVITIPTGASSLMTASPTAPRVNNIFISNAAQAYDRGVLTAQMYSGNNVYINGSIAYDPTANGQEFGVVVGARVRVYNGIYRITSARYQMDSISFTAQMDMTFDDLSDLFSLTFEEFNATYSGISFDQFNALWSPSYTFDQFNAQTTSPTFDDFNKLFVDMTFDDYSVFPYTKELIKADAEATI